MERIRLRIDEACDRICNIPAPRTGLEAKFTLRLTTAMALAGVDTGGLASYSEAIAADPTLVALRDKVEFEFRQAAAEHAARNWNWCWPTAGVSTARHDSGVPDTGRAGAGARLEEKFTSLVEPILGAA